MSKITKNILDINTAFLDVLYNDEFHTYYKNNKKLISTTTCISQYKEPFKKDYWLHKKAFELQVAPITLDNEWEYKKLYGQQRGNIIHDYLEYKFQSKEVIPTLNKDVVENTLFNKYELKKELEKLKIQADNFFNDSIDEVPIKLEYVIGNDNIGGMIDRLIFNKQTGLFKITDYKTDKEIRTGNKYQNFLKELSHLPDCNLVKYELQLSVYRKILTTKIPDLQLDTNQIIWFNKDNNNYQKIELRYLEKEAEIIINNEKQ